MAGDQEVHNKLQCDYPRHHIWHLFFSKYAYYLILCYRFYQHASIQRLSHAVLERIGAPQDVWCVIFPSEDGMQRCSQYLRSNTDVTHTSQEILFSLSHGASKRNNIWACFCVVLCPVQLTQYAEQFWGTMGDGISSRHADYLLERLPFMDSVSSDSSLRTYSTSGNAESIPSEPWKLSDADSKMSIKSMIAGCINSQNPSQKVVTTQDVFLYPKGMCAIGALSRTLALTSTHSSEAVIFG